MGQTHILCCEPEILTSLSPAALKEKEMKGILKPDTFIHTVWSKHQWSWYSNQLCHLVCWWSWCCLYYKLLSSCLRFWHLYLPSQKNPSLLVQDSSTLHCSLSSICYQAQKVTNVMHILRSFYCSRVMSQLLLSTPSSHKIALQSNAHLKMLQVS